ncbi:MAG: energy transducer TonB [Puniceicoccaceae bacterium]
MKAVGRVIVGMLVIPFGLFAKGDTIDDLCEYEQPILIQEYWPVLSMDPLLTENESPPILDLILNEEGKTVQRALLTKLAGHDLQAVNLMVSQLQFTPAYACGEVVEGFYRYRLSTYFFPNTKEEGKYDSMPVTRFSLPSDVISNLESVCYILGTRQFAFELVINESGKVEKLKAKNAESKAFQKAFLKNFFDTVEFVPARLGGDPVPLKMHMHINLQQRIPKALLDTSPRKPLPKRPPEGTYEAGETHAVLLSFYGNGSVRNIQFLTVMNYEESLSALRAFRSWKITPISEKYFSGKEMQVKYTFADDEPEAIVLNESLERFMIPPKPSKQAAPVYPAHLWRLGVQGVAMLVFVVDKQGFPRNIRVEVTTHRDFGRAAISAVETWEFEPALLNGNPVNTRVRIPIPFRLRR